MDNRGAQCSVVAIPLVQPRLYRTPAQCQTSVRERIYRIVEQSLLL